MFIMVGERPSHRLRLQLQWHEILRVVERGSLLRNVPADLLPELPRSGLPISMIWNAYGLRELIPEGPL
jgi:hypothetical protein